ncbi:hypothetical protein SNEBB_006981 [Seison nebaliae]|nr:hypothetical protein SNEBB_006981 [Seison nebaliae]
MPKKDKKKSSTLGNQLKKSLATRQLKDAFLENNLQKTKAELNDEKRKKLETKLEETTLEKLVLVAQEKDDEYDRLNEENIRFINLEQNIHSKRNEIRKLQELHVEKLLVPRRPNWSIESTKEQLELEEENEFMEWRKKLNEIDRIYVDKDSSIHLQMTPYEKNLNVWRQLWRTLELSDILIQLVDARNPLLFRNADLEDYFDSISRSLNITKVNILVFNKSDFFSPQQIDEWKFYCESQLKINVIFWSAKVEENTTTTHQSFLTDSDEFLERILKIYRDQLKETDMRKKKLTIGMVGYPNVGKSSTINRILGQKKVSVSATPGKTKHIQTFEIVDNDNNPLTLCDCPGLVFPTFVDDEATLFVEGISNIDQMNSYIQPMNLISKRFTKQYWQSFYNMIISVRNKQLDGLDICGAYARSRGKFTARQQPNYFLAAKIILKDYVNGKLLFCHAPPHFMEKVEERNEKFQQIGHRAPLKTIVECKEEKLDDGDLKFFQNAKQVGFGVIDNRKQFDVNQKKKRTGKKREKLRRRFAHLDE